RNLIEITLGPTAPLYSLVKGNRRAHTLAQSTIGLTRPIKVEPPEISFTEKVINLVEWKEDLLAVGVTEKDMVRDENSKFQSSIVRKHNAHLGGLLVEASLEEDLTGKTEHFIILRLPGLGSERVGLFGLGQSASTTAA
ncbi:hypothetical protein U1Q18_001932, partial [Sarracenia purpurea var. burkii]